MNTTTTPITALNRCKPATTNPIKLHERIGSTVFTVNINSNNRATETLESKILRIIEREANWLI